MRIDNIAETQVKSEKQRESLDIDFTSDFARMSMILVVEMHSIRMTAIFRLPLGRLVIDESRYDVVSGSGRCSLILAPTVTHGWFASPRGTSTTTATSVPSFCTCVQVLALYNYH